MRLEGKSIQSVSPQGLKFSVAIENPSSQDVTLRNLFDGRLKPYLRDLAGEIVELSKAATRMEKEHTARFGQRHAPDDMKIPAPYLIGEVKIGTKVLSSDDLQAETFIIPAKSQFTATISIDKVMRVPSLAPGNKSQSKIVSALPTGHYYLQLFLHCDSPQWENRASFNFGLKRNAGLLVRYVEPIGEAKLAQFR
ncbi:hypothetical protein EON80_14135 [bacterium]|nr:MAG: hypothetical protein EON80_14135 [bacterium]